MNSADPSIKLPDGAPTSREVFKPKRHAHLKVIIGMSVVGIVAIGVVIGLMWQSNSFIAQNQDMRSNASEPISSDSELAIPQESGEVTDRDYASPDSQTSSETFAAAGATTGFIPGQQLISIVDQRFGINGGCLYAKALGIPWTYNWGWMNNADRLAMQPDNINEVRCYENNRLATMPMNTLITLAKNDGITTDSAAQASAVWSRADVDAWISKARTEGKWDVSDQADFAELDILLTPPQCDIQNTIENKCSYSNGKRFNLPRIKASYVQIPFIAARYPGAHYQIANEPEFGFSYFPETYAKIYRIFYDRIKKYDPNAKVTIGSIGLVEFDHPFNQAEPTFKRNTGYQWIIEELGRKGMDTGRNRDIAWLALVYNAYQQQNNGKSLPVDFVAIHPYPWPPSLANEYKKFVNGNFYSYQWPAAKVQAAVADSIAQIDKFRLATIGAPYRYGKKPLWITEINVLVNKNETRAERDTEAEALQKPYMIQLYQQLMSTNKVQKIFWHTGLNEVHQPTKEIESGFVFQTPIRESGWNALGEELMRQKKLYPDSLPPQMKVMDVQRSGNKPSLWKWYINLGFEEKAGSGQRASGIYRIWYAAFESSQPSPLAPTDPAVWKSVLTTAPTSETILYKPSIPPTTPKLWFSVQVEDAFGNISAPMFKQSP